MPEQKEIFERAAQVISETLKIERSRITRGSRFVDDLNADSLDMLTLLMQLEDEFGKKIPDEVARTLTTVGSVLDYLGKQGP